MFLETWIKIFSKAHPTNKRSQRPLHWLVMEGTVFLGADFGYAIVKRIFI